MWEQDIMGCKVFADEAPLGQKETTIRGFIPAIELEFAFGKVFITRMHGISVEGCAEIEIPGGKTFSVRVWKKGEKPEPAAVATNPVDMNELRRQAFLQTLRQMRW